MASKQLLFTLARLESMVSESSGPQGPLLSPVNKEGTTMYLDTHNGPVEVSLTGNEATAPVSGVRYVEVSGWLKEPIFVDVSRLSDSPDFSQRAMQRRA